MRSIVLRATFSLLCIFLAGIFTTLSAQVGNFSEFSEGGSVAARVGNIPSFFYPANQWSGIWCSCGPTNPVMLFSDKTTFVNGGTESLRLRSRNQEIAIFNSFGRFGVGTTEPAYHVDSVGRSRIVTDGSDWTAGVWYSRSTIDEEFAGILSEGPDLGSQQWGIWLNSAFRFRFVADGNAWKFGSSQWIAASDIRVKKDVSTFADGLSVLERIQPVWFHYNGLAGSPDDGPEQVGVIAQELEAVAPFMVHIVPTKLHPAAENAAVSTSVSPADEDVIDLHTVDPSAFRYMLVNATKEIAAQQRKMLDVLCPNHPDAAVCKQ